MVSTRHGGPWWNRVTHEPYRVITMYPVLILQCVLKETATARIITKTQKVIQSPPYARKSADWQWTTVTKVTDIHETPLSWNCCHVKLYNLFTEPTTSCQECQKRWTQEQVIEFLRIKHIKSKWKIFITETSVGSKNVNYRWWYYVGVYTDLSPSPFHRAYYPGYETE